MSTAANDDIGEVGMDIREWSTLRSLTRPARSTVRLDLHMGTRTVDIELTMEWPNDAAFESAGITDTYWEDGEGEPGRALAAALFDDHRILAEYAVNQAFWLLDLNLKARSQIRECCNVPFSARTLTTRAVGKLPAALADEIVDADEMEWQRNIGDLIHALVTIEFDGSPVAATRTRCDGCGYWYSLIMGPLHHLKRCRP